MKVNLIDYTGKSSSDPLYAARLLVYTKNTRLTQGEDTRKMVNGWDEGRISHELDYVANTIRSSWEMVDFTFEVQGVTRAFTHQLVRTRTASYAQQAQRVVAMNIFETRVPATVQAVDGGRKWAELMTQISATYTYYQERDVPNQDCRGVLPTNVLTNIIVKMNLRTFADLVGKRENLRAQDEYTEVIALMKQRVLEVMPWTTGFLNPARTATPNLDKIMKRLLGNASPVDNPEFNSALKEIDALKATWG